ARAGVYFFRDRTGVMHFTNVPTDSRFRVLVKDELPPRTFSSRRSPYRPYSPYASSFDSVLQPPADIAIMIDETAHRYGVEPALVHAVVRAESDYDHLAVSPAGARGLMQLMPGTASLVGVRRVFEPRENLDGGVYYLRYLLDRFSGNVQLAVAAYNAGPGAVETYGGVPPYAETLEYVQRVFRFRQQYLRSALDGRLAFAGGRTR
ncbi:MAG TPA: lytic transglycosylase domain-containing protein, partial [Candidatus Bathyarchaeia archaeon]|nr:lytic transglycosylase domain-containing protein [Candidatus Bathyarchaeia archaeon]